MAKWRKATVEEMGMIEDLCEVEGGLGHNAVEFVDDMGRSLAAANDAQLSLSITDAQAGYLRKLHGEHC